MPKPVLLKLLAGIGIFVGALSAMWSAYIVTWYLMDHDAFVNTYLEAPGIEALNTSPSPSPSLSPSPSPSPVPSLSPSPSPSYAQPFTHSPAEEAAEELYSRRGVTLPLAAIDVILSLLLLFGCLRALRGSAWGLSAWTTACLATIPYNLVSALAVVREANGIPLQLVVAWGISFSYCAVCLIYLRLPRIRGLFR